jgi:hypothetical protein
MSGPYDRWRLPALLEMVEADPQEATSEHLKAWQNKRDLLAGQKRRLTELVHELTTSWDPARSEAAQALVATLNDMIATVDRASARAASTLSALESITAAIGLARNELRQLAATYHDKTEATREFNRRAVPFLPDSINPGTPILPIYGLDLLAMRQHQDALDRRARAIMSRTDRHVNDSAATFEPIPVWGRYAPADVYDPLAGNNHGAAGGPAAVGLSAGSSGARHMPPPPVFDPPGPSVAIDAGPALTGSPVASPSTATGPPTIGSPPPVAPWLNDAGTGRPVMRPGGVIGDVDARHRPVSRPLVANNGIIDGRTGYGVHPSGGVAPQMRSAQSRRGQRRVVGGEPDDPWTVAQGVPPVLEASPGPERHDAGAGVIGIDR